MNPTTISVPSQSGALGDAIADYVLDRVSGDVEKHLGTVVEDAMSGASVPIAALVVLDSINAVRRAYFFAVSGLVAALRDSAEVDRRAEIESALFGMLSGSQTSAFLTVADPTSTVKTKQFDVEGLTQNASVSGTSGIPALDDLFVPVRRSYGLGSLIAKCEDLALSGGSALMFVSQEFPEISVAISDGAFSATSIGSSIGSVVAQVNGVFVTGTSESNPSFGFESGGAF